MLIERWSTLSDVGLRFGSTNRAPIDQNSIWTRLKGFWRSAWCSLGSRDGARGARDVSRGSQDAFRKGISEMMLTPIWCILFGFCRLTSFGAQMAPLGPPVITAQEVSKMSEEVAKTPFGENVGTPLIYFAWMLHGFWMYWRLPKVRQPINLQHTKNAIATNSTCACNTCDVWQL